VTQAVASVEWVDDGEGRIPVFFDRHHRLVDVFHDYVVSLADRKRRAASAQAYTSTVESATYALLGWLRHLEAKRVGWLAASDARLEAFRDGALKEVLGSARGKRNERTAKRTVNVRLQWIYRFYRWAQQDVALCSNLIGPRGAIRSTITLASKRRKKGRRSRDVDLDLYPQCFGGVSGHAGGSQYFATPQDKRRITEYFSRGSDPFIVERNRLIVELTDRVGWRASTLTGLTIDDFGEDALVRAGEAGLVVTPAVQKFAYQNRFEVPDALVARIARYIGARRRWLTENGWSEARAKRRLFLVGASGRPFGPQGIVQLLGRAFRATGVKAGIGAGHHSFRRKFSDESTEADLEARRALGYSTAVEDVMHATALRLGQRRIDSQAPYQRAVRSGTRQAPVQKLRDQVIELETALADKDQMIADLQRQLGAVSGGAQRRVVAHRRQRN
jgi:hypothetical protein